MQDAPKLAFQAMHRGMKTDQQKLTSSQSPSISELYPVRLRGHVEAVMAKKELQLKSVGDEAYDAVVAVRSSG